MMNNIYNLPKNLPTDSTVSNYVGNVIVFLLCFNYFFPHYIYQFSGSDIKNEFQKNSKNYLQFKVKKKIYILKSNRYYGTKRTLTQIPPQ